MPFTPVPENMPATPDNFNSRLAELDASIAAVNSVTATGSTTSRTLAARFGEVFNVKDYGAEGDGVTDATVAFTAAITAANGSGGYGAIIYLPAGTYLLSAALPAITKDRVRIRGEGQYTSVIDFQPASTATLFTVRNGANEIFQNGFEKFGVTGNTNVTKTIFNLIDTSLCLLEEISVVSLGDTSNSVAVLAQGREFTAMRSCLLSAPRPIVIRDNPNNAIDCDHFHCHDLYLLGVNGSGFPCIDIGTGVNVSNLIFDGYQSWVAGDGGLKWVDTTTGSVAQDVSIRNLRREQGTGATNYAIQIEHNSNCYNIEIDHCSTGLIEKGIKLRKCINVGIRTLLHPATTDILDIDSTVPSVNLMDVDAPAGCSASIASHGVLYQAVKRVTTQAVPSTGMLYVAASIPGPSTYNGLAVASGASILPGYAFSSESSLGWYRPGTATMAPSYGTVDLALNATRLSIRSVAMASLTSVNVGANELVFAVGASGCSLAYRSGGTLWYPNSSLSTRG